jgi:hypothetical protein
MHFQWVVWRPRPVAVASEAARGHGPLSGQDYQADHHGTQ